MVNPLTGDYDAAVQVNQATLNRLVATMHQNYGNDADLPTLPHGMVARIGDVPESATPPGGPPVFVVNIRGTASVQVGAPTVSFVAQTPRDVDLSCWVRVRYRPDPGTVPFPEFIHGRIVARYTVQPQSIAGSTSLRATVSNDDAGITFTDSGLNAADLQKVEGVIRPFLRSRMEGVLKLPDDIPDEAADFRIIHDSQGRHALALPITLAGSPPASGSFGEVFLDGRDFAIGVSKDFILSLIQPQLDAVKATKPTFSVKVKYWGTAHYTVTFTEAAATWLADGRIHISVKGEATTPAWWSPNVSFGVSQDLKLVIHFLAFSGGPDLSVVPVGEPSAWASASGPFSGIAESYAKNAANAKFVQSREDALAQAQPLIASAVAKTHLLRDMLVRIDDGAKLDWKHSGFSGDGLTLSGVIVLSPRKAPRVTFSELGDGSGYSAFDSWVPGGRITSFAWTWWQTGDPIDPLTGDHVVHSKELADRYVLQEEQLPIIPEPTPTAEGGQPTGGVSSATASVGDGTVALATGALAYDPTADVSAPVWGQACLRLWLEVTDPTNGKVYQSYTSPAVIDPDLACTFAMKSPPPLYRQRPPLPRPSPFDMGLNVLVFVLPRDDVGAGPEVLREVLPQIRRDAGLALVLATSFRERRPGQEQAMLALELQRELPQVATLVADVERPWPHDLNLPSDEGRSALRLVDPEGHLTWQHDGMVDASTLASALSTNLVATRRPRGHLLRTTVGVGDRGPDFAFELARGRRAMLRSLRGRSVGLLFVPNDEVVVDQLLDRFSARATRSDDRRVVVIVVGEGRRVATGRARRDLGFDVITVSDAEGRISRQYGIQIRPTVVLLDRDGRVSTVQMMAGETAGR